MIYKRATRKLRDAGITNIHIVKRLWGASPEYINLDRQISECFASPMIAADAVIPGFRPRPAIDERESNTEKGKQ